MNIYQRSVIRLIIYLVFFPMVSVFGAGEVAHPISSDLVLVKPIAHKGHTKGQLKQKIGDILHDIAALSTELMQELAGLLALFVAHLAELASGAWNGHSHKDLVSFEQNLSTKKNILMATLGQVRELRMQLKKEFSRM